MRCYRPTPAPRRAAMRGDCRRCAALGRSARGCWRRRFSDGGRFGMRDNWAGWSAWCRPRIRAARPRTIRALHTAGGRLLLIGRRREAAIRGRHIGRASKDRDVVIESWCPQRLISGSADVHLICRDDLMLGLLNGHELAEFGRLHVFPFSDRFGMRFKHAEHFVDDMRVAPEDACARLLNTRRQSAEVRANDAEPVATASRSAGAPSAYAGRCDAPLWPCPAPRHRRCSSGGDNCGPMRAQ